jgi:hypothetical protein
LPAAERPRSGGGRTQREYFTTKTQRARRFLKLLESETGSRRPTIGKLCAERRLNFPRSETLYFLLYCGDSNFQVISISFIATYYCI